MRAEGRVQGRPGEVVGDARSRETPESKGFLLESSVVRMDKARRDRRWEYEGVRERMARQGDDEIMRYE